MVVVFPCVRLTVVSVAVAPEGKRGGFIIGEECDCPSSAVWKARLVELEFFKPGVRTNGVLMCAVGVQYQ